MQRNLFENGTGMNRNPLGRRSFLANCGLGFGSLALGAMLHRDGLGSDAVWTPPTGEAHFPAKAKSVIWLFMNGGLSHMESFDPKPMLTKYAGKTIAETPFADAQDPKKLAIERLVVPDGNGNQRNTLYPLQVGFRKHGESGIEVSDWFPHVAKQVDKLAIVRSMWTTDSNHGAQTQFHSGRHQNDGDFPTLGAWIHYGLGSLNEDLPQFISMGFREYWNKKDGHYLGPEHDAVPLRVDPNSPLDFGKAARPFSDAGKRIGSDLIQQLNTLRGEEYPHDQAMAARIASYELAFRMQSSVPELTDISKETEQTYALYGEAAKKPGSFAHTVLLARRMVERGVRFIQVYHNNWDTHGNVAGRLPDQCRDVDQPCYGLIQDLKQRGLLDSTLIIWGGEFGRTIYSQGGLSAENYGRDHHPRCYTMWMAGGGTRGGTVYGETDDFSYNIIKDPVHIRDFHATVLNQLGFDHERFSYRFQGLDQRLTGVEQAKVIKELITS